MIAEKKKDYHASLLLRTTKLALSWSVSLLCGSNCCCCCLERGETGAPISKIKSYINLNFNRYKPFRLGFEGGGGGGGWTSTFNLAGSLDDWFGWLDVVVPNIGFENTGDSYHKKFFKQKANSFLFTIVGILLDGLDRAFRNRTVLILFVERVIKLRILFNAVPIALGNCGVGIDCSLRYNNYICQISILTNLPLRFKWIKPKARILVNNKLTNTIIAILNLCPLRGKTKVRRSQFSPL
jgi:hypothetical protein